MQLKVASEGEANNPPPAPDDVEVLAPNRKYLSEFPRLTAFVLLGVVLMGVLSIIPGLGFLKYPCYPVAIYGGVRLGAWLEQAFYARFHRRAFLLRAGMQLIFFVAAIFVTGVLTGLLGKWSALKIAETAVSCAGFWASFAALGSIVIITVDKIASATSDSFRVRVACAVLGLIGVALSFAFVLAELAVVMTQAAQGQKANIQIQSGGLLNDALLARELANRLTDPRLSLIFVFGLSIALLIPALVSAAVKFADAVMDRIYPMQSAFSKVGGGNRKVRLEEGGAKDFRELANAFNQMVSRLALAERMERAFGIYVSGHVLEKIKAQHGEAILPAAIKDATVFFADIRGFTTLSERLQPETLVALLNRYFEEAVGVIQAHDGYLNKFIGDAIVVVFNGPIDQPDHAERAVKCAMALQTRVAELNAKGAFPEIGELKIGIGVSTGPMTCGNVGSARQMEYTVIGDTVNLAARLTSHAAGSEVWISELTAKNLPASYGAQPLPPIKVKGKEAEVTPWRVLLPALAPAAETAVA